MIWVSLLVTVSFFSFAQKDSCVISFTDKSQAIQSDYYLAGNINNWNPSDQRFKFMPLGNGKYSIVCYFNSLTSIEWKVTRGSWESVECDSLGKEVPNHSIQKDSINQYEYSIFGWKNLFSSQKIFHTTSKNVHIIDTAFYLPELNEYRRVWIYLPKGYSSTRNRYPVLYMHDGQNLFDEATSGYGEWGIDECLDSLIDKGVSPCIVVGIDNGSNRITEYNPYDHEKYGKGQGDLYIQSIIRHVKPAVDKRYRTLRDASNTIIAGSSLGGLISMYAAIKYPTVFGSAGIFSPAFWVAPELLVLSDSLASKVSGRLFFYMGKKEGEKHLRIMKDYEELLGAKSNSIIYSIVDPNGEHNEKAWQKWFADFYKFTISNGYQNTIKEN